MALLKFNSKPVENRFGYLVWFQRGDSAEQVRTAAKELGKRRISLVRTGLSWAEWDESSQERERIIRNVRILAEEGFSLLLCLNYTPPRLGINPMTNSPPRNPKWFGEFILDVLRKLGDYQFELEVWNEPNLNTDWDPEFTETFVEMVAAGAEVIKGNHKDVILGGINKIDTEWMDRVGSQGLFELIDVFGVHGLRGTWSDKTVLPSWEKRITFLEGYLRKYAKKDIPIWITEVGFPPVDLKKKIDKKLLEEIQVAVFADVIRVVLSGATERVYWYTLFDLDPQIESVRKIITGWEDKLQHYFGDSKNQKKPKLLGELLREGGSERSFFVCRREKVMAFSRTCY